tara:strand:+ start:3188 stop:3478 length:291 start_codon:yes stop_codon:yes gene_type:complete
LPDSADEAEKIEKAATAPAVAANEQARQAWRSWVIPAVGSMAFFSSMLINGFKNYRTYGFPAHTFTRSDWVLLALPVVVVVVAMSDIFMNNGDSDD